jgi:hypothetical protein
MRVFLCSLLLLSMVHSVNANPVAPADEALVEPAQHLFINSMSVASSEKPGKAAWKATCRFNSDRTGANRFNPISNPNDNFVALISTHRLEIPAASFTKSGDIFKFKSAKGVVPVVSVQIDISSEKITLSMTQDTFEAPLANLTVPVTFALGSRQYSLLVALDKKGTLVVTPGYRTVSFVGTTCKAELRGSGLDTIDFDGLLADPNFHFTPGNNLFPIAIKLFNGDVPMSVINVDHGVFSTTEKDGKIYYKIKSTSSVEKTKLFQYDSKTGKFSVTLRDLTLSDLVDVEEKLTIEFIIDNQDYITQQTIFRKDGNTFQYAIP